MLRMQRGKRFNAAKQHPRPQLGELKSAMGHSPLPPSEALDAFPPGFRRLATTGKITTDMVQYLGRLFVWVNDIYTLENIVAAPRYEINKSPGSTTAEKMLTIGFQVYLDCLERKDHQRHNEGDIQSLIKNLGGCMVECDEDTLTWSCMMLAGTFPTTVDQWLLVHRALADFKITVNLEKHTVLSNQFLPIPELSSSNADRTRRLSRNESRLRCASLTLRLLDSQQMIHVQGAESSTEVDGVCQ